MYLGKNDLITNPNLSNEFVKNAIIKTNNDMCSFPSAKLSQTIKSTLIGEILQENLTIGGLCQRHNNEKGHPDILPLNICNKKNYYNNIGFDIKVTCGRNFSSHHNHCQNILGVFWENINSIPQIVACVYLELNQDSWTTPASIENTRNTNCCTVKPDVINNAKILYATDNIDVLNSKIQKIISNNIENQTITLFGNPIPIKEKKLIKNKNIKHSKDDNFKQVLISILNGNNNQEYYENAFN